MSGKSILVVDEDGWRRKLNAFGLRCAGFAVNEATNASSARSQIAQCYPHLVLIIAALLDFGIQDLVRSLRGDSYTRDLPVLALVERDSELGTRSALEWGIDDCMLEPISPEAFVARVRAGLELTARSIRAGVETLGLTVDNGSGLVRWGARTVTVGPTERRVLALLLAHPEQTVPRDLLLFRIWGGAMNLQSRVLDVSVCRLRRALEQLGCEHLLQTVSRHGYRLSASAQGPRSQQTARSSIGAHQ